MCIAADSLTAVTVSMENLRFEEITITKREKFTKFNRKQLQSVTALFFFYVCINMYIDIIKRNSILEDKEKKKR
jgi:hypothetical protein